MNTYTGTLTEAQIRTLLRLVVRDVHLRGEVALLEVSDITEALKAFLMAPKAEAKKEANKPSPNKKANGKPVEEQKSV